MRPIRLTRFTCILMALVLVQCGGGTSEPSMADDTAQPAMLSASTAALDAGDWPMYRGAPSGTGYSPLDEIDPANVGSLARAWTYDLNRENPGPDDRGPNSQVTPIVVDGVMYLPAPDRVVALDPATGEEHWRHMTSVGAPSRRGVSWWPGDGTLGPRIIFMAGGTTLVALDAATGEPADGFGNGGAVEIGVPYNSVPLVHDDVVVVGANTPAGTIGGIGNARAFDARTGAKLWEFDSVAQPGQPGHDTWAGDSWQDRLGANAWPFYFTVDEERSLLYVPLASPIPGYYGGDRAGANLYGNAVVAVDLQTGAYRWHFQTIHHDLWDADPPAPPTLFDIASPDGTVTPALGVTTKSGYLYLLNRETGEPIHGVEEQAVAQSDVPGEATAATQPIPVKPASMGRVRYTAADLVTAEVTSAEHAAACSALVDSLGEIVSEGPFTPWAYRAAGGPPRTTLNFPGGVGGPNWGGVAFDPATRYAFVFTMDVGALGWMVDEDDPDAPSPYRKETPRPASFEVNLDGVRMPCQTPPWGQLIAVDTATGDIVWQERVGVTEILPEDRQRTGRPGRAAAIVTGSGLLFIGATDDNRFRALEAGTGQELWVDELPGRGNAIPMTYRAGGRQYVAIAATDQIVTYALP